MSASIIDVHSHPILPAYRKALGKASGKPPEERQLSIHDKFHGTLRTAWLAWAAAYCRHALISSACRSG